MDHGNLLGRMGNYIERTESAWNHGEENVRLAAGAPGGGED